MSQPEGIAERRPLLWVGVLDCVVIAASFVLIALREAGEISQDVPFTLYVGAGLSLLGIITFTGYYRYHGSEGMRTAIAASTTVVYLVLVAFLLSSTGLREELEGAGGADVESFGRSIFSGFTVLVGTVYAFYLGSTTTEKVADRIQLGKTERARIAEQAAESGLSVPGGPTNQKSGDFQAEHERTP
jgi:hypothetical protein